MQFPNWLSTDIIPGLPFKWYGMMYIVAFAVSYLLFMVQVRQRKLDLDKDLVLNFFFWAIIGLLVGARLFSTLFFEPTGLYRQRPWLIFWPFYNGQFTGLQGMNYYGGVVGAVVAVLIYARAKKIKILDWGDMMLAGVPLGYTFGRFGNFINAELYGRVTKASWGFLFPTARRFPAGEEWVSEWASDVGLAIGDGQTLVNLPRHPTQLYEALAEGVILWLILWFLVRKRKPYDGFIIGLYIVIYGVMRFVVDYFRMPISATDFAVRLSGDLPVHFVQTPLNLIPSQFYSLAMIVGGVVFLVFASNLNKRRLSADGAAADAPADKSRPSMRKLRKKIK
jgi:phosphatidylglycerol:prolipoprotein diacylglycerol transferase